MNEGHGGTDGGTFPQGEAAYQEWSEYVKRVASGNSYGGEPCNQADGSTYDWSNYAEVCGPNGLQAYIEEFGVAYLNVSVFLPWTGYVSQTHNSQAREPS